MGNPILHMVNAFRYGILGVSDIRIGVAIGFMLLATAALYTLCIRLLISGTQRFNPVETSRQPTITTIVFLYLPNSRSNLLTASLLLIFFLRQFRFYNMIYLPNIFPVNQSRYFFLNLFSLKREPYSIIISLIVNIDLHITIRINM